MQDDSYEPWHGAESQLGVRRLLVLLVQFLEENVTEGPGQDLLEEFASREIRFARQHVRIEDCSLVACCLDRYLC